MHVPCPLCQTPVDLGSSDAGALVRCRACGKSFVAPRELVVTGQQHKLTPFSVAGLLLLHYVTVGLFTLVHLNMMHDKLPRIRRTDPSGLTAVGLSFVPGVNLLWFFFTFRRLAVRINEQRRFRGMPETTPQVLPVIVSTLLVCGFAATMFPVTGWVLLGATNGILVPVFIAVLQASVNELAEHREQPAESSEGLAHAHGHQQQGTGHLDRDLRSNRERGPLQGAGTRGGDDL